DGHQSYHCQQSKRNVPLWIFELTGSARGIFKSTIGKQQKQYGFRERIKRNLGRLSYQQIAIDKKDPDGDKQYKRKRFGDGQNHSHFCSLFYPDDIDPSEDAKRHGDHKSPPPAFGSSRP